MLLRVLILMSVLLINAPVAFCTPGKDGDDEGKAALLHHQHRLSLQVRDPDTAVEDGTGSSHGNVDQLKDL